MRAARIFLVEDEALVAMEMADRLQALGYDVTGTAARGEAALARIPDVGPDLVLMDVNLSGGLSGIDVAERLRDGRSDVPIVFLTAYSDPEVLERARATEPSGFLVKPYDERELHATIQMALYRHEALTQRARSAALEVEIERRMLHVQKTASLARMAGGIAHSFNNLLTSVIGNLEMAEADLQDPEACGSGIAHAKADAWRAAELSRAMITYVDADRGSHGVVDVADACRAATALLSSVVRVPVKLSVMIPGEPLLVTGDAALLGQVLGHLAANADEAMGEAGGELTVRVDAVDGGSVRRWRTYPEDWAAEDRSYVCLSVGDTGQGVPAEIMDRIFDPFFSTRFPGRGLGLAMVMAAARSTGGAVAVDSDPGRGSTFRVVMPLAAGADA